MIGVFFRPSYPSIRICIMATYNSLEQRPPPEIFVHPTSHLVDHWVTVENTSDIQLRRTNIESNVKKGEEKTTATTTTTTMQRLAIRWHCSLQVKYTLRKKSWPICLNTWSVLAYLLHTNILTSQNQQGLPNIDWLLFTFTS